MNLIEIKDKGKYNDYVSSQKQSQFLQSWEWGEFQESVGNKIIRLGVVEDERLVFGFTLIEKDLFLGMRYWYAPRVNFEFRILSFDSARRANFESIFNELINKARADKIMFLRFDPVNEFKIQNSKFKIQQTVHVQPEKTLILDISKSEEELLKQMHQKTRYNIRLAGKKGVEVEVVETRHGASEDFEEWWQIMEETCKRDGFRLHTKYYYQKMLGLKIPNSKFQIPNEIQKSNFNFQIKLIVAKYQNKIIAGNIISFFGDMATYIHGASSNEYRNVMAPYALQWHSIQEAKKHGCKYYDFYGIDEDKWPGVTRFKKGFSGEEVNYPGTWDLVFNKPWYSFYKVIRRIRRMF